jgi:hypothetical protein
MQIYMCYISFRYFSVFPTTTSLISLYRLYIEILRYLSYYVYETVRISKSPSSALLNDNVCRLQPTFKFNYFSYNLVFTIMNLWNLRSSEKDAVEFFQQKGLLPRHRQCNKWS